MATSAICIVKTMRLQKPSPKDLATACGLDPFSSAAPATTTTAMAANTKASGNQRSAQAVKRRLRRLSSPPSAEASLGTGGWALWPAEVCDVDGMGVSLLFAGASFTDPEI